MLESPNNWEIIEEKQIEIFTEGLKEALQSI